MENLGTNYADEGIWIFVLWLPGTSQEEINGCFVLLGNTPCGIVVTAFPLLAPILCSPGPDLKLIILADK